MGRMARRRPPRGQVYLGGAFTGSRHDAVLRLRWLLSVDAGWVELEQGLIYRRGAGESESSKRRPPVPISPRLAAHLRRWKREFTTYGAIGSRFRLSPSTRDTQE